MREGWGPLTLFKVFLLLSILVLSGGAQARVGPEVEHAQSVCLDLAYSGVKGGKHAREQQVDALEACKFWHDSVAETQPGQLALIDALRSCHLSYSDGDAAVQTALVAAGNLKNSRSPLGRSARFIADMCLIKARIDLKQWEGLEIAADDASAQLALHPNVHRLLWKAYYLSGRFGKAEKHIRLLTKISRDPSNYIAFAETLIKAGKYREGVSTIKGLENAIRRYLGMQGEEIHDLSDDPFGGRYDFLAFQQDNLDDGFWTGTVEKAQESLAAEKREQRYKDRLAKLLKAKLGYTFEAKAYNLMGDYQKAHDVLAPFLNKPIFEGPASELLRNPELPESLKGAIQKFLDEGGDPTRRVKVQEDAYATISMWQEWTTSLVGLKRYDEAAMLLEKKGSSFPERRRYFETAIQTAQATNKEYLVEFYQQEMTKYPPHVPSNDMPFADSLRFQLSVFMPKTLVIDGEWGVDANLDILEELIIQKPTKRREFTTANKGKKREKRKSQSVKNKVKLTANPELEVRGTVMSFHVDLPSYLYEAVHDYAVAKDYTYFKVQAQHALAVHQFTLYQPGAEKRDENDGDSLMGFAANLRGQLIRSAPGHRAEFDWIPVDELGHWVAIARGVERLP